MKIEIARELKCCDHHQIESARQFLLLVYLINLYLRSEYPAGEMESGA